VQGTKPPATNSHSILSRLLLGLERFSARTTTTKAVYTVAIVFFLLIVIIPAVAGIVVQMFTLPNLTLNAEVATRMRQAVMWSFVIGLTVSGLDVLAGIPVAWLIVRRRGKLTTILDSLADIPFVVPTVALGFSILEFWSNGGGISQLFGSSYAVPPGAMLIALLHFAFSFPVIVRVMVGELLNYRETYEVAARTLGASAFTAVRTVTMPILRPGILAAFLLALARSLSETGATIVVAGTFETGTVFISDARGAHLTSAVVMASLIMIVSSLVVFALIKLLAPRIRVVPLRVWPNLERKLSESPFVSVRNGVSLTVFLLFVLLPCLHSLTSNPSC
jgi:ABC-type sulfate transport system permease component